MSRPAGRHAAIRAGEHQRLRTIKVTRRSHTVEPLVCTEARGCCCGVQHQKIERRTAVKYTPVSACRYCRGSQHRRDNNARAALEHRAETVGKGLR